MAEAALVSVSMGVMKPLISKLTKLLEEESAKLKGVRRNTRFIRDELSTMGATLQVLADSQNLDPQTVIWRDSVRELSYDMDDCINDFMVRADHNQHDEPTGLKGFFSKLKKLKPRHEIAGKIQELKARAVEVSERHKRYQIDRTAPASSISAIDPRLEALYVEVEKLVGIEGPKEEILEWFKKNSTSEQLKVMSIVGPGGLGKTTLANQVYNTIKSQFPCAALVSVSRQPDLRKVLRDIAKGVGAYYSSDDDVKQLIDGIRECLQDKRYLVVVDDVWDTEAWKYISLVLTNNNCGSRIIATTRISEVASCSSSQGGHVYQMKHLSFADYKRLLFSRAFGSDDFYPHLEKVSDKILEKCDGLPLAIITISSLLANQRAVEEWDRVLAVIGTSLANDPLAENMTKILSLSYIDLPHHLRTCLLYLSLFPEDHIIEKRSLISRWIAEGFIHEEQGRSKYEVGEGCFNDLVNRNLIQPIEVKYGQAEACLVHDIILDFITCKAIEENFMTIMDGKKLRHNSDCTVRRLSVMNLDKEELTMPENMELSHVRSLTLLGSSVEKCSWLLVPSLVMLDIGQCWNEDDSLDDCHLAHRQCWNEDDSLDDCHLAHIGKMFLLKYLHLGLYEIKKLPRNMEELRYIETLDLRGAAIYELPSTITRLPRLTRLYVSRHMSYPDGIFGQLPSLEEFYKLGVYSCEGGKFLQEFAQLTNLRTLDVRCHFDPSFYETPEAIRRLVELYSHVGTLISSDNLHNLYFHFTDRYKEGLRHIPMPLESLCYDTPCSLRKLHMLVWPINKVPKWMSSLGNLTELELFVFSLRPEDIAILGAMPALLLLTLSTFYGTNRRILIRGFTGLKYFKLEIKYCGTALEFEAGSMRKLEHLELGLCVHRIKCVNGISDFGIRHLPALTKVDIKAQAINESLIRALVGTLRICPTISLDTTLAWLFRRHINTAEDFVQFVSSL